MRPVRVAPKLPREFILPCTTDDKRKLAASFPSAQRAATSEVSGMLAFFTKWDLTSARAA
jgi:hypothetical protein